MNFHLKPRLRRFTYREDGDVSLESIIVLPILLFLFAAVWVWHDVSHEETLEDKINYTIGDIISRETDPVDNDYIDATYDLLLAMLDSTAARSDMRITVVRQTRNVDQNNLDYEVVWSEARGARPAHQGKLNHMADRLPVMARNDQVIVVETWRDYTPDFEAGLDAYEIASYSFTRPRFAPQVLFEGGSGSNQNNGWGNGDQDAPGNSLCNNNAENIDEALNALECLANIDGSQNIEPSNNGNGNGNGNGGNDA